MIPLSFIITVNFNPFYVNVIPPEKVRIAEVF